MAVNAKIVTIIAIIIIILTWILYVVANAVPHWSTTTAASIDYKLGLWVSCAEAFGITTCSSVTCTLSGKPCSNIRAARAFLTMACIFSAVSAICLILSLILSDKLRSIALIAGKVLAFVALITGIIGVAVGINIMTNYSAGADYKWGASSAIGIIAIIINAIGAVVSIFIK